MTNININEFQKRASQAGLSKEQIDNFVTTNFLGGKTAEQHLDEVYTHILTSANLEKNEKTAAYVEGFLTAAIEQGAPFAEAVEVTKQALAKAFPQVQKQAELDPKMAAYAEGFIGLAKEANFTNEQTIELLKFAAGQESIDPAMLQQLMALLQHAHAQGGAQGQPAPDAGGMPGAEAGPDPDALKGALMQAMMQGQGAPGGQPQPGASPMFKQLPQ